MCVCVGRGARRDVERGREGGREREMRERERERERGQVSEIERDEMYMYMYIRISYRMQYLILTCTTFYHRLHI